MTQELSKLFAVIWFVIISLLVTAAIQIGPSFDTSIMSLLPKSAQQPLLEQATKQTSEGFSKRLLLLFSGSDEDTVRQVLTNFAADVSKLNAVSDVRWQVNDNELAQLQSELFSYRFVLLDQTSRELLQSGQFKKIEARALSRLYSPMAAGQVNLIEDPFALFSEFSQNRMGDLNIQVAKSLLKVSNTEQATFLVLLSLAGDPFSMQVQQAVLPYVVAEQGKLQRLGVNLTMSGMILHAAAGAKQANSEISSIGLGSLLGIVAIILLVFRQIKPLILMLIPITVGCLTATAVTILVFERVHLITLAFGAGLVGVSIDYALHFVCERRLSTNDKVVGKILPGLFLGLFSSVMAYAAQAFAPFPGLQQMAVFSVVGLLASWLTVVLWLPGLTKNDSINPLPFALKLSRLRSKIPQLTETPLLALLLTVFAIASVIIISTSDSLDDIRLLQTSPASLLAQEKRVQTLLGTSSSAQFLLVKGKSVEECLQIEERLRPGLQELHAQGRLVAFQSLSQQLPSLQKQSDNSLLVKQLYEKQLEPFYTKLHLNGDKNLQAINSLQRDAQQILHVSDWLKLKSSEAWRDMLISQQDNNSATVIRFVGIVDKDSQAALQALISNEPQVQFIDQVQNISDLMKQYRHHISQLILMAYIAVFLVLFWRYRSQLWRVILPPILASLYTLAALVLIEHGMNLFHLMALILVLGIGLDMGIFLMESGDAPHTWLAVSLSSLTSVLAFGLLALSATPVLHHFGLTVLLGLTLVWLIAPTMRKSINKEEINNAGETL